MWKNAILSSWISPAPFLMCLMAFIGDSKNKIHACLNKWCKTKSIGYMKSVNRLNGALHHIRNGCEHFEHCKHTNTQISCFANEHISIGGIFTDLQ